MSQSLLHSLEIIKANDSLSDVSSLTYAFYCGFTPLHLRTFFHASLCELSYGRKISLREGRYGDLLGSLLRLAEEEVRLDNVVVPMEWEDFDPRLGLRSHGGWSVESYGDIITSIKSKSSLFLDCFRKIASRFNVVVAPPSSPFPPFHFSSNAKLSLFEAAIKKTILEFYSSVAGIGNVCVLNDENLKLDPCYPTRYSLESLIAYGFPYSVDFSSLLAERLARLAVKSQPLKGIILDLDDTLWKGILGEDGVEGVSWDLDHGSHSHGVFQAFIQSLADAGVLVAIASKNSLPLVEEIFRSREGELWLKRSSIFPVMAGWERKSASIQRILAAWNIASNSVVFIDDSPLEIEEVRSEFPDLRSFIFPTKKPDDVFKLILTLRDLFAKESITEEDSIRLKTLKQRDEMADVFNCENDKYEELLQKNNSIVTFHSIFTKGDDRAFELLNKTNQFNMNGVRLTDSDWRLILEKSECFAVAVSYEDRFGPLGKISVITGCLDDNRHASISSWVMSCRAFGRRIEYSLLKYIFNKYDLNSVSLNYVPTDRNGPFGDFIDSLGSTDPVGDIRVSRDSFIAHCPPLYHEEREISE